MQSNSLNSLAYKYPELAAEWHPTKNGLLTPADVLPLSGKKVWWQCLKDPDHEWESLIQNRSRGRGCPYCSNMRPNSINNLLDKHPNLAAEWHPTKNGILIPLDVAAGSTKKVWWKCSKVMDHEWQT